MQREVVLRTDFEVPPEEMWRWFTGAEYLGRWLGVSGLHCDAHPGGALGWTGTDGDVIAGEFLELVPQKLIRFSQGDGGVGDGAGGDGVVGDGAPGGGEVSEVMVTFAAAPRSGATSVELVVRGLEADGRDATKELWSSRLARLESLAGPTYCESQVADEPT
ncbi:MAG: SRPBCC domain-containing protein [Microthrixaceae bacterium]